jgi:hypothetical protein
MLTRAEIQEQHALAERKCADFEDVVTQLINAGFPGTCPLILTRDEIIELVRDRWGEPFLSFAETMWQFTVH